MILDLFPASEIGRVALVLETAKGG